MRAQPSLAEIDIHLRARAEDKALIDQAARLLGYNRSQFMIASALREAKNILLDQSTFYADAKAFHKIMDWMDGAPTKNEKKGMSRLARQIALAKCRMTSWHWKPQS